MDFTLMNHVGIRVVELERARAFYEKLGFVFIMGPVGPEPVAVMEHPGGIAINLILNAHDHLYMYPNALMDLPSKRTGYTHMALETEDLDVAQRELTRLEIPITEGPIEFDGARYLFIRDPDYNVIEIHQPAIGAFRA